MRHHQRTSIMAAPGEGDNSAILALGGVLVLILLLGGMVAFLMQSRKEEEAAEARKEKQKGPKQRGAMARMAKRAAAGSDDEADGEDDDDDGAGAGGKKGKAAKKEERKAEKKEDKKAQRAADQQARENKEKSVSQQKEKYNKKLEDKEAARLKKEQEEQEAKEAQAKKEEEEFDKWKTMFAVDAEGLGEGAGGEESEGLLARFVSYIETRKVVMLEELASEFNLKTNDAIERIRTLEQSKRLSGVFDDRGKFISISPEEMEQVARWLKQKGRINRADLVAGCNRLVRLNPTAEDRAKIAKEDKKAVEALDQELAATEDGGEQ